MQCVISVWKSHFTIRFAIPFAVKYRVYLNLAKFYQHIATSCISIERVMSGPFIKSFLPERVLTLFVFLSWRFPQEAKRHISSWSQCFCFHGRLLMRPLYQSSVVSCSNTWRAYQAVYRLRQVLQHRWPISDSLQFQKIAPRMVCTQACLRFGESSCFSEPKL